MNWKLLLKQQYKHIYQTNKLKKYRNHVYEYLKSGVDFQIINDILQLNCSDLKEYSNKVFNITTQNPKIYEYLNDYEVYNAYMRYAEPFKKLSQEWLASFLYPFVLFLAAIILTCFYLFILIPNVEGMLTDFSADISILSFYKGIGMVWLSGTFIIALLFILGMIVWKNFKLRVQLYAFFRKQLLIQLYLTYSFAAMMALFIHYNVNTQHLYQILRQVSFTQEVRWLSYYPDDDYQKGIGFRNLYRQDYFDPVFKIMLEHGQNQMAVEAWLERYCTYSYRMLAYYLKRISRYFKMFIFTYLILLMLMFYNLLYLPMKIMEVL